MATTPSIEPVNKELHRIAVTGIIWKKNEAGTYQYLLTKRSPSKKVWPNKWTVPGGGLTSDDYMLHAPATYQNTESPQWYNAIEHALRREIQEEVGVEVGTAQYLLDLAFVRPDGMPVIVFSYFCEYMGGEVQLDEDATEFAWVSAEEAQSYDLIQGIEHEIKLVDKRLISTK